MNQSPKSVPNPTPPTDFARATSIASLAASLADRFAGLASGPDRAQVSPQRRARGAGQAALRAPPLADETFAAALAGAGQVVFVLMDGLGEQPLATHAPAGVLSRFRWRSLDSVFPSSTAPALSALSAAAPPAAHGNPAWLMWSEQVGEIIRTLPMDVRADHARGVAAQDVWHWQPWMSGSAAPTFSVLPAQTADSAFSRHAYAGSTIVGYHSMDDVCDHVEAALDAAGTAAGVFVYLPHFDTVSHQSGCASDQAHTVVHRLDAWFRQLVERLRRRQVLVLVTADHGFIDVADADQLQLEDYPALAACLERPLSGEPRVPFCQVRATAQADFAATVEAELGDAFAVHTAAELLAAGWFGTGDALAGRLGTHLLVPRRAVTLVDQVVGDPPMRFVGMHGGPSEAEMRVPLIAAWHGEPLSMRG